jgi:CHAT domain-containing protein/tetratricopeptide (TPR) repeat protein
MTPRMPALVGLACLLLASPLPAAAPPRPLSAEQKQAIQEASLLQTQAVRLLNAGNSAEAIEGFRKSLAIEREAFGDSLIVAATLEALAQLFIEDPAEAAKTWHEVARIRARLLGKDHWRTADAVREEEYAQAMVTRSDEERQKLKKANTLHREGVALYGQGRHADAARKSKEAMDIRSEILGVKHPYTLRSLINVAEASVDAHSPEAFDHAKRVEEQTREVFGEDSPDHASGMSVLGRVYVARGELGRALPLMEQALAVRLQCLGNRDQTVTISRTNLIALCKQMGDHRRVISEMEQLCAERRRAFEEHRLSLPELVTAYLALAEAYQGAGDSTNALRSSEQALRMARASGEENLLCALVLNRLGQSHMLHGDFGKVIDCFEKSRLLLVRLVGEKHPSYPACLYPLASAYASVGETAKARELFEEALALVKKHGEESPHVAEALARLGDFQLRQGEFNAARASYEATRDLIARALGQEHPAFATCLEGLGRLNREQGDVAEARRCFEQAITLRTAALGELDLDRIAWLEGFAQFQIEQGEYEQARQTLEKAVSARKAALGERHPFTARSLCRLALATQRCGQALRAEQIYLRARSIFAEAKETDAVGLAEVLNHLGMLYLDTHDYDKGVRVLGAALDLQVESYGAGSPHLLTTMSNLALLYRARGDAKTAESWAYQATGIVCDQLELTCNLTSAWERNKLRDRLRDALGLYLSCADEAHTPAGRQYELVVRAKAAHCGTMPGDPAGERDTVKRWREVCASLVGLRASPPTAAGTAEWRKHFAEMTDEKAALELRLSLADPAWHTRWRRQHADAGALAGALPKSAALIDTVTYDHWLPSDKDTWKREERVVAFVLSHDSSPARVALGPSQKVDDVTTAWRKDWAKSDDVHRVVWEPLKKHLGAAKTVLVAPEGALRHLPWAALPGAKANSYLVEEMAIGQIENGRELIREEKTPLGKGIVALGGVDFGRSPPDGESESGSSADEFQPLPVGGHEVAQVVTVYRDHISPARVRLLAGEKATRANLLDALTVKGESAPWRYIHLATRVSVRPGIDGLPAEVPLVPGVMDQAYRQRLAARVAPVRIRVGLAGANRDADKGTVSLAEMGKLNLHGCELVVLSGTQSEERQDSDGLTSLTTTLRSAGAKAVLARTGVGTDAATSVLLEQFYNRLMTDRKMSRLDALRQAQLYVLRHPEKVREREHQMKGPIVRVAAEESAPSPGWWAGFVLIGEGW